MHNKVLRSFGRRKTRKLSNNAQDLYDNYLPEVKFNINNLESNATKINLEIGFGHGDHIFANAQQYTDELFIGAEPYINGIVALLRKMHASDCKNIKIFDEDARELLATLPNQILSKLYVLFPDPWPKARQNKKRLVNEGFLQSILPKLTAEGEFIFASDNLDYVESVEEVAKNASLKIMKSVYKPTADISGNIILQSKYALKARSNGSVIGVLHIAQ